MLQQHENTLANKIEQCYSLKSILTELPRYDQPKLLAAFALY